MLIDGRTGKSFSHKLPTLEADNAVNRTFKFPFTDVQTSASAATINITVVHKKTIVNQTVNAAMTINIATSPDAEAGDELILNLINGATTGRVVTFGTGLTAPAGTITGTPDVTSIIAFVHNGTGFIETGRSVTPIP